MQTADCWLTLNPGHNIPLVNITPAEAVILRAGHEANAKDNPIQQLTLGKDQKINSRQLIEHLRGKYGNLRVTKESKPVVELKFPGESPVLPQTFEEVGFVSAIAQAQAVLDAAPQAVEVPQVNLVRESLAPQATIVAETPKTFVSTTAPVEWPTLAPIGNADVIGKPIEAPKATSPKSADKPK